MYEMTLVKLYASISLMLLSGLICLRNANAECKHFDLSVTVDDIMILYVDGVPITGLPNALDYTSLDTVTLSCATKVIAIQGINLYTYGGIRASDSSGYIVTNESWKCTSTPSTGWEKVDFDDSSWPDAVVTGMGSNSTRPGLSADSMWIWSSDWYLETDDSVVLKNYKDVAGYCRKTLAVNECSLEPPYNLCNPSTGTCEDTPKGYNCHCFSGYTNTNDQTCEEESSNGQNSMVTILIILGVLLGIFVVVSVSLTSYLLWKSRSQEKESNASSYTQSVIDSNKVNGPDSYDVLDFDKQIQDQPYSRVIY